jgi:mono/diheme cytochrome c family protein
MESSMNCIKGIFVLLVAAAAAGLVTVYSGLIDVGASNPHHPFTRWLLETTMDRSVRVHARGIETPPLEDPPLVMDGFRHYREMCVGCHLAPGITSSEIRKGLTPEAPVLQEVVEEWTPAELFWIIKNGVKMTGMPAWGATHSNKEIWAMVAFLEKLPQMTAEQYREMDMAAGPAEGEEHGDHPHDAEHHEHDPGPAHTH